MISQSNNAREFIIHKVENRIINKIEKIYRKTVET